MPEWKTYSEGSVKNIWSSDSDLDWEPTLGDPLKEAGPLNLL